MIPITGDGACVQPEDGADGANVDMTEQAVSSSLPSAVKVCGTESGTGYATYTVEGIQFSPCR